MDKKVIEFSDDELAVISFYCGGGIPVGKEELFFYNHGMGKWFPKRYIEFSILSKIANKENDGDI